MVDLEFNIKLRVDEKHKDFIDGFNVLASIFQKFEHYDLVYNMESNITDSYRVFLMDEYKVFLSNVKMLEGQFL